MLKRVNAWAWAFGHEPIIARFNLISSPFMIALCGYVIWQRFVMNSKTVSIQGDIVALSRWMVITAVFLFLTAVSIIFDRSMWRAAFGKTKAPA